MEAKIDHFSTWIPSAEESSLRPELEKLLMDAGFTVLNFMEHAFEPQGYTAIWLLAESHCALHTFPEEDKSYLELSSCNTDMYIAFIVKFNDYLKQWND